MSKFEWSLLVWAGWLLLFLALELPALFNKVPWESLSSTSWTLEDDWHPLQFVFMFGLAVLLVHIVAKWPR